MQIFEGRSKAAIVVLFFLFLSLISWKIIGYSSDIGCWAIWCRHDLQHGLYNAYASGADYTPLYHYFLWLFGWFQGSLENVSRFIGYIRVFTIGADFLGLYLVYRWIDRQWDYLALLLIGMLNLAYSYNTIIWGQCDAIHTAFAFAAFYFLHRGKLMWSGLMLILSVNMKLQGIVLLPLWGLLAIEFIARTRRCKELLLAISGMFLLQCIILLPFAFGVGGIGLVWSAVSGLVDALPRISLNAFNFWYFLFPQAEITDDSLLAFGSISYKQVGLCLFCMSSVVAFLPLLTITLRRIFQKGSKPPAPSSELIWLTAALLVLLFFFFNTQMHERYSHPAFIFLTAFAFNSRRFGVYLLFSAAYFLNLEKVLRWFDLVNYDTLIFKAQFIAFLFALCIVWIFVLLFTIKPVQASDELQLNRSH